MRSATESRILALCLLSVPLTGCLTIGAEKPSYALRVQQGTGRINGFTQIPAGGNPGSTSHRRPELEELGIHRAQPIGITFERTSGNSVFYAGYRGMRERGRKILAKDLISNQTSFPAGADVSSTLELSWLRLGVGRRFQVGPQSSTTLTPRIEATLFQFSYLLTTPAGTGARTGLGRADRSFSHGDIRVGLSAEHELRAGTRLFASALVPLPLSLSTEARITSLEAGAAFDLPTVRSLSSSLLFGVSLDRIHFVDDQEIPNLVDVDLGPALFVGLEARF